MPPMVVIFEFKNSFIQRFLFQCTANTELSLITVLFVDNQPNTNKFLQTLYKITITISDAIFLSMFYEVIERVCEGETMISPDTIYASVSILPYLDKLVFKEENIIDNVDSYEAIELFDDINEMVHKYIRKIIPVELVNELIECVLENKVIIDNLHQSGYYVVKALSRSIIAYGNPNRNDAVYTYWEMHLW